MQACSSSLPRLANPTHLSGWDTKEPHQLARAHVPRSLQICRRQATKTELARQFVQDHDGGIESIGDRTIEIEDEQFGPPGGLGRTPSTPQHIAGKPSHAVTRSSGNFMVPLYFGSSGSNPKFAAVSDMIRCISSLDRPALSEASTNSRS